MKILVVEDEADVVFLIERKFKSQIQQGLFSFTFSSNGREAFEYLQNCPFENLPLIALVDIRMPQMNGLTLLGHIMKMYPFIKVIIVSAYGEMKNVRIAMNLGAFDFLTKPIDFDDLKKTLDKAIYYAIGRKKGEQEKQDLIRERKRDKATISVLNRFVLHFSEEMSKLLYSSHAPTSLDVALSRCEKMSILQAIARNEGNISKAAEELGVTRQHLHRKLKEYEQEV